MRGADQFRALLEAGDFRRCRAMWHEVAPHLPKPQSDADAEIVLHVARTASTGVKFQHRAYSHRWLSERGIPSSLPDELRPRAERVYPKIVDAVGVAVRTSNPLFAGAAAEVQRAMSDAVADAYANGDTSPGIVKAQMDEARRRTYRALGGWGR